MILSNVLGALGVIYLLKSSQSRRLVYFRKMKGMHTFLFGLIISNILFYIYFILESLLYKLIVVKSEYSEAIDGSAGGYFTTEEIANNYLRLSSFLTWSFLIINIILFLSRFFLKTKPSLDSSNNDEPKLTFTILLILLSIITCFISLILLVLLGEFSVSYGG
jgi:hypothetical protein